jgi:two-component system response regulator HydG
VDVIVTDLNMPGGTGLDLCSWVASHRPDVPVLVLTAFGTFDTAVAAIRAGAYDFLSKPIRLDVLSLAINRAVSHRFLREEVRLLRRNAGHGSRFPGLIGESAAMLKVYDLIDRISDSTATVLLNGESGTGKEEIARAIHQSSSRREGPFIAINCAAMPESLLESELFGHAKGAFTDARQARTGLFAQANGGTLLLDEIGDMPLGLQPKLLRVLQDQVVRPIGASVETRLDVRFIAATNRDLESAIEEKRFREDLYFRINVVHISLPPLRTRPGDVLPLANHFLRQFASRLHREVEGFTPSAAEKMLAYSWPGNVRELRNAVERAVTTTRFNQVGEEDLPEKVRNYKPSHVLVAADDPSELVTLEEVERRYILRALEAVGGNKTAAARVLGIERKTLYRKLEKMGLVASTEDS